MQIEQVFKALADPTRRRILKRLKAGELSAGELADGVLMSKASLSHHFAVLKSADLVRSERRGQRIIYSINTTVFEDVSTVLMDIFEVDV